MFRLVELVSPSVCNINLIKLENKQVITRRSPFNCQSGPL